MTHRRLTSNPTKSKYALLLFAMLMLALVGCGGTFSVSTVPIGTRAFPPRSENYPIALNSGGVVDREHLKVAEIIVMQKGLWSEGSRNMDAAIEAAKSGARKVGADAIVNFKTRIGPPGTVGQGRIHATGVAVRFTNEEVSTGVASPAAPRKMLMDTWMFRTDPPGGMVSIDGSEPAPTPLEKQVVLPGFDEAKVPRVFAVTREGCLPWSKTTSYAEIWSLGYQAYRANGGVQQNLPEGLGTIFFPMRQKSQELLTYIWTIPLVCN